MTLITMSEAMFLSHLCGEEDIKMLLLTDNYFLSHLCGEEVKTCPYAMVA